MGASRTADAVAVNGTKIRQLRKQAGMELADLAAAVNVTAKHLSYVETGRKPRVRPSTYRLICQALDLPRADWHSLLGDEELAADVEPERAVA